MKTSYDIIHTLVRTEKGSTLETRRQYLFEVAGHSNKIQIKRAVEEIYQVQVETVNTMVVPAKRKRVRKEFGHTTPWKKAVVTLKEGSKIDIT